MSRRPPPRLVDQLALFAAEPADEGGTSRTSRDPLSDPIRDPILEADRETRRLAQTEFRQPLLVQAGAGTGKTTTLTARIVAWCLGPGWERATETAGETAGDDAAVAASTLGGVVAITFTEAAAAEMAERAGSAFAALAGGAAPPWLAAEALPSPELRVRRATALVGTLDHLVVRTIHAFCRGLLAAHPLEAGVHPELTVDADGSALETVAREVVEAAIARGYGDPGDPDLLLLAGRGQGPSALVEALVTLGQAALPPGALDEDPLGAERTREPLAKLGQALRGLSGLAVGTLDGAVRRSPTTGEVLDALAATIEIVSEDGDTPVELVSDGVRAYWTEKTIDRLKEWSKGKFNQAELGGAGDRAAAISQAAGTLLVLLAPWAELDAELFSAARRALSPLHAELRHEMTVRGIATFEDLLVGARSLLTSRPEVARRVRSRIDQLLVDEFQDTDAVQCDIVTALALPEDWPEGWPEKDRAGDPAERPGLFVVGDPKQSIYGWRSADLRAYDAFRQRLVAAGGRELPLVENFRSVPAILEEVTAVVAPSMLEEPGLQPAFAPLVACERLAGATGFRRAGRAPVEYWVTAQPSQESDGRSSFARSVEAVRLEAEAIARDAARLHAEGLDWREMALLLRGFGELDEYLEAFRRAGVPFSVAGDRQYFRRREVIDAAALLRAVVDPGDQLALLAVLRAPFVGVPDAALLPLWRHEFPFPKAMTELTAPEPAALDPIRTTIAAAAAEVRSLETAIPELAAIRGWERVLEETVESLAELRRSFVTEPADRFLDRLRERIPLEATAAARYLGRYRLANLNRFFRRVGQALEDAEGDIGAILRALRRGVGQATEEEEGRPLAEDDALQVMTIHRAKGLDFGHVYLGQLHKTDPPDNPPPLVVGRVQGPEGPRLELRLFGQASPGFALHQAERRRVETRERVRLLYVAMTRAKERLVLAGSWDRLEPAGEVDQAKSALHLVAARFPFLPGLDALARGAEPTGGRTERGGLHWFFPALDHAVEAPEGRTEPPNPATVLDRGTREPASRRLDRDLAARHAARPLGEAVSAEAHRLLDELLEARPTARGAASRDVGMAIGTAVHRVLEELDPVSPNPLDAGREALDTLLVSLDFDDETRRRARAGALDLLERFERGPFLERLRGLEILARELPLLAPAPESAEGALVFRTGSIDLLARDRETGEIVVVDYKTDATAEDDLSARAAAYAPQLETYARAVAESFPGDRVRAELWFLASGRVVGTG